MRRDMDQLSANSSAKVPKPHRTVDRVTRILEEVVYNPGLTFSELVEVVGAAKSSVHGFLQGLLHRGWLYDDGGHFYLGPAVYSLTLASGQIRAGLITHADLAILHEKTGAAVFAGVRAGDHLIYIAEVGSNTVSSFDARNNIRRPLLDTAGGKALLAATPEGERETFLRRALSEHSDLVQRFVGEFAAISRSGVATNTRRAGTRYAIAAVIQGRAGGNVASITLVGETERIKPQEERLSALLLEHVRAMESRSLVPREAI